MKQWEKVVNEEHFHIFFKTAESKNIVSHGYGSWCAIDMTWLDVPSEMDDVFQSVVLVLARATIVTAPLDDLALLINEREDRVRRQDHISSYGNLIVILLIRFTARSFFITDLQQETVRDNKQVVENVLDKVLWCHSHHIANLIDAAIDILSKAGAHAFNLEALAEHQGVLALCSLHEIRFGIDHCEWFILIVLRQNRTIMSVVAIEIVLLLLNLFADLLLKLWQIFGTRSSIKHFDHFIKRRLLSVSILPCERIL